MENDVKNGLENSIGKSKEEVRQDNSYLTGVRQVVWGLLLALLDFRISGIDILPDFIGYILVYVGLGMLFSLSIEFKRAQKFAMVLIPLAFMSLYEVPKTHFLAFESMSLSLTLMLLGGVLVILKLFMVYYICQGMLELTDKEEEIKEFSDLIKRRWRNYLVINGAVQVLAPFILNVPEQTMMIVMLISVPILLIMEILIIHLIHRFGKEVVRNQMAVE